MREEAIRILNDNPGEVERYKRGRTPLLGYFVGQLVRVRRGNVDPKAARDLFEELLS